MDGQTSLMPGQGSAFDEIEGWCVAWAKDSSPEGRAEMARSFAKKQRASPGAQDAFILVLASRLRWKNEVGETVEAIDMALSEMVDSHGLDPSINVAHELSLVHLAAMTGCERLLASIAKAAPELLLLSRAEFRGLNPIGLAFMVNKKEKAMAALDHAGLDLAERACAQAAHQIREAKTAGLSGGSIPAVDMLREVVAELQKKQLQKVSPERADPSSVPRL